MVDDFPRHVQVFLLKTKDQTFEKFKEWKSLIENQTDKKLKCFRTDNGLEFCNRKFDDLCAMCAITRYKTFRFNPQQNGVLLR